MKSKKLYGAPIIELTALAPLDVITTSGAEDTPSEPPVTPEGKDDSYDLPWP